MDEVIKRYEALTSEQKELCDEGFKWAYERLLDICKKDEEDRIKTNKLLKDMECTLTEMISLNVAPELIKKRRLLMEQFKELGELELELKWILPLANITN